MKFKKTLALVFSTILLCGCNSQQEDLPKLNEWQKNLLEAEGLPTEYDQLTAKQQNTIDRVWTMISYLNEKYGEEFIYVDYIPQELNQSETLTAYPRSTGSGGGKYFVTVKNKNNVLTDDYSDFGVADLAEELTNDFLTEQFGDNYKYFASPLACDITMAEMEDGKFQWKYGANVGIFLCEDICSIDNVEEFAVKYAKFLYEHELDGMHRIEVLKELPEDEEMWKHQGERFYGNEERLSTGFYVLFSNASKNPPSKFNTEYIKYDQSASWYMAMEYEIDKTYTVEEYFSKYD